MPTASQSIALASSRYYSDLYAGVVEYSRDRSWLLDASNLYSPGWLPPAAGCDGIVASIGQEHLLQWALSAKCPIVHVLDSPFQLPQWPRVVCDLDAKGRLGAKHLLDLGNINFAYYCFYADSASINETRGGFIKEMEAHGRFVHRLDFGRLYADEIQRPTPRAERIRWLQERLRSLPLPLAIMTGDDRYAVELVLAARGLGLRIPEDVAILGSEDQPFIRGIVPEGISSIDVNFQEIGRRACELLDRILQGAVPGSSDVPMLVKVPPKGVVARQSTMTFSCDHPGVTAAALFIRRHFHEPISVKDVAAYARMSVRTLQTEYPLRIGRTVKDDILKERLNRAQFLLERTDFKLGAVAVESGFKSDQYLCHIFRQKHGTTPLAWRNVHAVG